MSMPAACCHLDPSERISGNNTGNYHDVTDILHLEDLMAVRSALRPARMAQRAARERQM